MEKKALSPKGCSVAWRIGRIGQSNSPKGKNIHMSAKRSRIFLQNSLQELDGDVTDKRILRSLENLTISWKLNLFYILRNKIVGTRFPIQNLRGDVFVDKLLHSKK